MSEMELQLVVRRLLENWRGCKRRLQQTRRYDLQKQLEGRIAAYEVCLRLHGVSLETESNDV